MASLTKFESILEKILNSVIGIFFTAMLVTVGIQVVARYIPSLNVSWTEELTRLLFVGAVCFGGPLAMKYKEYVGVDILTDLLGKKTKDILFGFIYGFIAIFCLVAFRYGINFAKTGLIQTSPTLKFYMVWPYGFVAAGFFLNILYSLLNAYQFFKSAMLDRGEK